jgi:hypothetical protein
MGKPRLEFHIIAINQLDKKPLVCIGIFRLIEKWILIFLLVLHTDLSVFYRLGNSCLHVGFWWAGEFRANSDNIFDSLILDID